MFLILRKLIDSSRGQRGQVLVMGVGVLIMSLGVMMISVDVGWWLRDKRDAQNDTDAIALAAVQEIGDPLDRDLAIAAGLAWAGFNGVDASQLGTPDCADGVIESNFCFIDQNSDGTDDMVRVKVSRPSISFIADAFGVGSPTLNPQAAAAKIRAYGACVLPWAIDAHPDFEDPEDFGNVWGVLGDPMDTEQLFVFQLSPGGGFAGDDSAPGNFGALGIYGANASSYVDTIVNECGSQGENACDSDTQAVAPGESLDCDIQTGNLGANTNSALNDRAERFGEVAPYTDCDASSYSEAITKADSCQGRLVVLAIIKDFPEQGSDIIDIYGIVNFYISGWDRCPPFNDGNCFGPIPDEGIAWGYLLLEELGGTPAWQFDFSQTSNNPFAPVIVALVE
ncbi:MAG: hypothetical protein IIC87_05185 [Chloroflexi bacterium]|nr:hypothetical protein [Chloroflexota bacterium]